MSHDIYDNIIEKPWSVRSISLRDVLNNIRAEMGENAVFDFDRDIATIGKCSCGEKKELYIPMHKLNNEILTCQKCGNQMSFDSIHLIKGDEDFLDKTPYDIGIPLLHIISGRVGMKTNYYEFTGDELEIFKEL